MKPKMMSKRSMDYLFDHILDGFKTSYQGIMNLKEQRIVGDDEIADLIQKNTERLIERVREFRIHEKLFGVFFACLFGYMQITGEDLEMRRARRAKTRRRDDVEQAE